MPRLSNQGFEDFLVKLKAAASETHAAKQRSFACEFARPC